MPCSLSILNMKMANSNVTKRVLAESLKELVREIPLEKITIADICGKHNMNRKSFYYHFKDKYDLLKYIFQMEFMAQATADNPDEGDFFYRLCLYLYENQDFYRHVFRQHQHNYFLLYFQESIQNLIESHIDELVEGSGKNEFHTFFLTDGIFGAIQRWITDINPIPPEEVVNKTSLLLEKIGLRISQKR